MNYYIKNRQSPFFSYVCLMESLQLNTPNMVSSLFSTIHNIFFYVGLPEENIQAPLYKQCLRAGESIKGKGFIQGRFLGCGFRGCLEAARKKPNAVLHPLNISCSFFSLIDSTPHYLNSVYLLRLNYIADHCSKKIIYSS